MSLLWQFGTEGGSGVVYISLLSSIHLFQVAVKAFRFSFATEGGAGNKSIKVIICVATKEICSKLPCRCSVESLEFGRD
jgi:hypothetical protein